MAYSQKRPNHSKSADDLNEIYQLSDDIVESQARVAVITYNERRGGLIADRSRAHRIYNLHGHINQKIQERHEKIMQFYSGLHRQQKTPSLPTPSTTTCPPRSPLPSSSSLSSSSRHSSESFSNVKYENFDRCLEIYNDNHDISFFLVYQTVGIESERTKWQQLEHNEGMGKEENIWSIEPISPEEKAYYRKCRDYCHITKKPVFCVSDDIFNDQIELPTASLVCVLDLHADEFNEQDFLQQIRTLLNINDIEIKRIQKGCVKVIFEVFKKVLSIEKKIEIRALYNSVTDYMLKQLEKLKVLFMFMGDIKSLNKMQKFRDAITLHPEWNLIYGHGHTYWNGTLTDGRDRGDKPYFCPVGWQRYSFYVSDNFYEKFKGWSVCYHGTKFEYGLAILLSGLTPANAVNHGQGIYVSPSIIYTSHPRYSEVKEIESNHEKSFFKKGKYVQFVLQCRVHPANIKTIAKETLGVEIFPIDPNVTNDEIEWIVDTKGKAIMNFNDPNSTIVCTGLMVRVTDNHPGLLTESNWWFHSHLCPKKGNNHCLLGIDLDDLKKKKDNGQTCNIVYE